MVGTHLKEDSAIFKTIADMLETTWPISSTIAEKRWKLHAKVLKENGRTDPVENKIITKAPHLKIGQPVFVKDHQKGTFT